MTAAINITSPEQAVREMIAAGAVFAVRRRDDALGFSFSYRVADCGDMDRCREILAAVKSRPPVFYQAFRAAVQDAVASDRRGAA